MLLRLKPISKLAGKLMFAIMALTADANLTAQQIIVYINPNHWEQLQAPQARSQWLHDWGTAQGVELSFVRSLGSHSWVIRLNQAVSTETLQELIQNLNKDPAIEHAEEDAIMTLDGSNQIPR